MYSKYDYDYKTVTHTNKYGYTERRDYCEEERYGFIPCVSYDFIILDKEVKAVMANIKLCEEELKKRGIFFYDYYEKYHTIKELCKNESSFEEIKAVENATMQDYENIMAKIDKCSDCIVKNSYAICSKNIPENLGCKDKINNDGISLKEKNVVFTVHQTPRVGSNRPDRWFVVYASIKSWKVVSVSVANLIYEPREKWKISYGADFYIHEEMISDHTPTELEYRSFVEKNMSNLKTNCWSRA